MKKYYLYTISCLINNKVYVGVTFDAYTRFCHHRGDLRGGRHDNRLLQSDYSNFGPQAFVYDIISEFDNRISALRSEKYLTECVLNLDTNLCYNLVGGGTGLGFRVKYKNHRPAVSDETKSKMSISGMGRLATEETKKKRSDSLKGANCYKAKKVVDVSTGKVYGCLKDTLPDHNFNYNTLRTWLNGVRPNKSTLKWL